VPRTLLQWVSQLEELQLSPSPPRLLLAWWLQLASQEGEALKRITMCAILVICCAHTAISGNIRGSRCSGSTRRMTSFSGPSWRKSSTQRFVHREVRTSSYLRLPSEKTGTRFSVTLRLGPLRLITFLRHKIW